MYLLRERQRHYVFRIHPNMMLILLLFDHAILMDQILQKETQEHMLNLCVTFLIMKTL